MLNERILGTAIIATADGTAEVMNISPFFPRHKMRVRAEYAGFSGTMLVEGSDTGLFAGEEVTLYTSGALTTETSNQESGEIVAKKYMRHSTTRTAGTVTKVALQASS